MRLSFFATASRAKTVTGIVVALFLASCGGEETLPVAAPETARTTAQGAVVGFVADNGAHVWRGLPYADSTAGENRWRAPRSAPAWSGVRDALTFAERCAQQTSAFDEDEGLSPGLVVGSEDCLALDIYAPRDARAGSLPVMVWIHGGGNVSGRSSIYDGSRLAENEDVIVIAVQYRVGPLGWFSHAALQASAEMPEDAAASFATLDLIASLKWIRDNIGAFGGDPDNVTIFGESAGGHNVVTLLASPRAEGLFHRAIVQSGSFDSLSIAEARGDAGNRLNASSEIARKLGATSAEELRAVSLETLFSAYERGPGLLDVPRVIQDGVVLPAGPLRNAFASTETFHRVPIMVGTNRDEMKLFYLRDERLTRQKLGVFTVARDQPFYDAITGYISRIWRIRAVDEPAAQMADAGHRAVYAYRFDWDDGGRFLYIDLQKLLGAAHGFEIPFIFNRFQHLGDADFILFQDKTLEERERLSRVMGGYWASFARDGVPSAEDAPVWPVYSQQDGSFLRLDTQSDGGIEVVIGADSLEALAADLNSDGRLDEVKRCFVVTATRDWLFSVDLHPQLKATTTCE